MKKECKSIKGIEGFVRNSIMKLVLCVDLLIVFLKRDIYCVTIFTVTSFMGYIRFCCMSDMFSAVLSKESKVPYLSIVNYFLVFFMTVVFFKRYCLGYDETSALFGILGITIVSFGIIFGCISGELSKMR